MLIQLTDQLTQEDLGLIENIKVADITEEKALKEITESWNDFHVLEEHELDSNNVDDFVTWHNENWETQIIRVFIDHTL